MFNLPDTLSSSEDVLFVTLDSCRYDTFLSSYQANRLPNISSIAPLHKAFSPSYFTYGSHASFWMGFTPGVAGCEVPLLNPKAGKLFRMQFSGHNGSYDGGFPLEGANIIEGFKRLGYLTIGSGAVNWFDPDTPTGQILGNPFHLFHFAGDTWSLNSQLDWIDDQLTCALPGQPRFVFLNIGETHVPYWHRGATWPRHPSPCRPFGAEQCDALESAFRQQSCLEWVDDQLSSLISKFLPGTIVICSDHGDCWGEDGLWEHGISHPMTLTVPLMMRVRGVPVSASSIPPLPRT